MEEAGKPRTPPSEDPRAARAGDRAHPADDHDGEREDDELAPHQWRDVAHRRGEDAAERREHDPEAEHRGDPAVDVDPERPRKLRTLGCGANDHPEPGSHDDEPPPDP